MGGPVEADRRAGRGGGGVSALRDRRSLAGAGRHHDDIKDLICGSCSPPTRVAASGLWRRRPACTSTTRRTGSRTRRSGCCLRWPRERAARAHRGHVPRRAHQRLGGPPGAARRAAHAQEPVAGRRREDVVARCTGCSIGWRRSPSGCAPANGGPYRKADCKRRQHRDRRLGSRAGDGLRGAPSLRAPRLDLPLRLQRRPTDFVEATHDLDPDETLFIVSSKTFTTLETMTNARTAREWCLAALGERRQSRKHFVAVSTNAHKVASSGSTPPTCSASGTGSAAATRWTRRSACRRCSPSGRATSRDMLAGFHAIDEHFATTPFERNLPVLMGLLAVWYGDFFGAQTVGVMPTAVPEAIPGLPPAADDGVERQARHARRAPVDYETGAVYWGEPGTNGQHSFYQLIHQGTKLIPLDLIASASPQSAGGPPRPLDVERVRPGRGAGVRQDRAGGARGGDA